MVKRIDLIEEAPIIEIPTLPGFVLEPMKDVLDYVLGGAPLLVGLDVGYGVVKGLAWGFAPVKFKTIYGSARDLGYDEKRIMAAHPGDAITTGEGDWFIGDLAATQLSPREQLSLRGRDNANTIRRIMMQAAIGKLLAGVYRDEPVRVRIATGLPVGHMKGASKLKEELLGRWLVETDQAKFPIEVEHVAVMPQPTGTINAYSLMPNGDENPHFVFSKVGVIDNGKFSVDLSTEEDALHIEAQSGTSETGMHTAFERIALHYNDEFGEYPDDRTVERIMLNEGSFKVYGTSQNWRGEVLDALKPMREATISLLREKIGRAAQHDIILNVGGPAPLVKDVVRSEYRQAMMPDNSQITNALGYLHYAGFAASDVE